MSNILTKNLGVVGMVPKGTYDAEAYYDKLNIVNYNGVSYIAKTPSTGVLPTNTEYWQPIADGIKEEDIVDNLNSVATNKPLSANQGKILNDNFNNSLKDNYYEEITYTKERYYDTDCYIVTIPKYDNDNNIIMPYVGDNGTSGTETPLTYAQKENTTLTINASLTIKNTITGVGYIPSIISNGEIIRNKDLLEEGIPDWFVYVGIKADRSISEYQVNSTTAQQMINDGVLQAFDAYWKLVDNGEATDLSNMYSNEGNLADSTQSPRQCIGVKENGDIIILTCDGRTSQSIGLYCHEAQEILIAKGCLNAWNLDGGGSTSTSIKGSKLNRNIDENGTKDRYIRFTLNVKKNIYNQNTADAFSKIGEEKQNIIQQIIPYVQSLNKKVAISIHGYGYEDNILSQDNTYEPIKLNTKSGDDYSKSIVVLDKEHTLDEYNTVIKINKIGIFKVDINLVMKPYANGDKFVQVCKNNSSVEYGTSNKSNYMTTNERGQIVSSFLINQTSKNDYYIVYFRGKTNDSLYRSDIIITEV